MDDYKNKAFNPLDKVNIAKSIVAALLEQEIHHYPLAPFPGAGVYALYYAGDLDLYKKLSEKNKEWWTYPIYVGKAIPEGARKGSGLDNEYKGEALYSRLNDHASSISSCAQLDINDFTCRYLVLDDIWIALAETLLIERFQPVWNVCLDGFGNHAPGKGRSAQRRSQWDTIHPGRKWAEGLRSSKNSVFELRQAVLAHLDRMPEETKWMKLS